MRKIILLLLVLIMTFSLGSCRQEEALPVQSLEYDDGITIGFSMGTLLEDRWLRDREIFMAMAQQEDVNILVTNANLDSELQYEQVKNMLEQGIDVLIITPGDSNSEKRCVDLAKQNNVPVIAYDRLIYESNVDAYISFDNVKVGELMAGAMLDAVPKGGYIIVNGAPSDDNSALVNKGIKNILTPKIQSGDIKLLDETWIDGWARDKAYEFIAKCTKRYGDDIDGIIAANDSMVWGAENAIKEARIDGVQFVGQDADLVACRRIVQGKQLMTVYKPIKQLVEKTMELAIKLANGEELEPERTINDRKYDVPEYAVDVIAVTEENMDDTVIAGRFHFSEDVYINQKEKE